MSIRRKELPDIKEIASRIPSIEGDDDKQEVEKKLNYGKPVQMLWALLVDYIECSTIHCVRYLGERRRPAIERVWWMIVFFFSVLGCGKLIINVWNKWDQSPVIVSFAEKSTPIWEIPFPAVTICPETKAKQSVFNFTEAYHNMLDANQMLTNLTDEDRVRMEAVAQICEAHLTAALHLGNKTTGPDIVKTLRDVAPKSDEILFFCKWRNSMDTCNDLFSEIWTDEGLCYTFNLLDSKELLRQDAIHDDFEYSKNEKTSEHWTLENGYDTTASVDPFPVRVLAAGARGGLFVLLRLYDYDLDYICRGPVQGFKILLHTPGEMPQVSKQYFRIPLNTEVIVSVKPNMMTTSEGLRHYEPKRRQCFFNSERQLKFFQVYTQQNCELECLANFTLKACGCVKFSMPRDKDTKICGSASIECYNEAEDNLLGQEFEDGLMGVTSRSCNCLPACTSIIYDAEISQAKFDWEKLFVAFKNPLDEFPGMQSSRISIFFKENQFITSKRSELYGQTDFLANCGGLLGLFMGVSLLSFVEIIYFCTLRLCNNLKMRSDRKKSLRRKLEKAEDKSSAELEKESKQ